MCSNHTHIHVYICVLIYKSYFVVWAKIKQKKEVERFKADTEVCSLL